MTYSSADGTGWPTIPQPRSGPSADAYFTSPAGKERARREFLRHAAIVTGSVDATSLPDSPATRLALEWLREVRERGE